MTMLAALVWDEESALCRSGMIAQGPGVPLRAANEGYWLHSATDAGDKLVDSCNKFRALANNQQQGVCLSLMRCHACWPRLCLGSTARQRWWTPL